jgi:glucosamine kinase
MPLIGENYFHVVVQVTMTWKPRIGNDDRAAHRTGRVDAGGTSTRAVVFHPSGQFLGYAVAGCGSPTAAGPETAAASVAEGVMGALRRAKVSTRIRLVMLAMAGAGRTSVAAEVRRRLAGIGLDAPLIFESDLLATYFSGTHRPDGYAVIAGTGAGRR